MSRQDHSLRDDHLEELTPEELQAQELLDQGVIDDTEAELLRMAGATDAERRKREAAEAETNRLKRELARRDAERLVYIDVIGGGRNATTHPDSMDLIAGSSPAQLLANLKIAFGGDEDPFAEGPIVLVPVRIWPMAIQPSPSGNLGITGNPQLPFNDKDGNPIPNLVLGMTRIQQSYASVKALVEGHRIPVSLTGMATINVNPFNRDPNAVADNLDRSARWTRYSSNGADTNNDTDTPSSMDTPAFTPSEQPPDAPSRPDITGGPHDNVIDRDPQ